MFKKCKSDKSDFYLVLLEYRNTPLDSDLGSPADILMNRTLRTRLTKTEKSLATSYDCENRQKLLKRQKGNNKYYERTVDTRRKSTQFKPGDAAVYRDNLADRIWKQAQILSASGQPRSYDIVNGRGRVLNRNTKMLLPDKTGRALVHQQEEQGPSRSTVLSKTIREQQSLGNTFQYRCVDLNEI